jgi:hypothetical protein
MKSLFKTLDKITQSYLGETIIYQYANESTVECKAIFETQFIEVNGVSSQAKTCDIVQADLEVEPGKGDSIIRDSVTYQIENIQINESTYTLILKD